MVTVVPQLMRGSRCKAACYRLFWISFDDGRGTNAVPQEAFTLKWWRSFEARNLIGSLPPPHWRSLKWWKQWNLRASLWRKSCGLFVFTRPSVSILFLKKDTLRLPVNIVRAPLKTPHISHLPDPSAQCNTMASKCVHKGCGKTFDDPEEACVYHPGPPVFHEGQKGEDLGVRAA